MNRLHRALTRRAVTRSGRRTSRARSTAVGNDASLTIDIAELRRVLDAVLGHVEATHGRLVDVDHDLYWMVTPEATFSTDLHRPGSEDDDLVVGQITDDINSVRRLHDELLRDSDAAISPWHDLEHAAGLLRALAWKDFS